MRVINEAMVEIRHKFRCGFAWRPNTIADLLVGKGTIARCRVRRRKPRDNVVHSDIAVPKLCVEQMTWSVAQTLVEEEHLLGVVELVTQAYTSPVAHPRLRVVNFRIEWNQVFCLACLVQITFSLVNRSRILQGVGKRLGSSIIRNGFNCDRSGNGRGSVEHSDLFGHDSVRFLGAQIRSGSVLSEVSCCVRTSSKELSEK